VRQLIPHGFVAGLCATATLLCSLAGTPVMAQAKFVQTPYQNPKALVDIYLDDPAKLGSALYWLRSLVNPLTEAPYSMFAEDMSIIVLLHGTEIVTLARKNEEKYTEVVQRMRYYAEMGVKFKVCGLAMQDYQYTASDMHDFVEVTPSAITELMHWQNRGYALITPQVSEKKFSIDSIR
jgi:intracellular sulfur oxidation DsrE/DsrF family protein